VRVVPRVAGQVIVMRGNGRPQGGTGRLEVRHRWEINRLVVFRVLGCSNRG
jgi:hypothetical protein